MARLGRALWQNHPVSDHPQRLPTPLRTRWEYASKNSLSALRRSCGRSTVSRQRRASWITTCCNSSEGQTALDKELQMYGQSLADPLPLDGGRAALNETALRRRRRARARVG